MLRAENDREDLMYPTTTAPLVLNERLPDPAVKILDKSFEKYRVLLASVERLSQGYSWAEGPVWFGDARCLLWSDIPNNRIMRWDAETGATSVYRQPSNYANGNTRDRQGRLVTAEHGRRVTRTEYDGRITVLCDRFEGKRLSSPNDVVVKSDDSIWFTDMTAGIDGNWNGETGEQELSQRVYRIDGKTGQATVVTDGLIKRPNGLAFSPDEKKLYVIESQPLERAIYVFDVDGAKLANGKMLIKCTKEETPDGFRVDRDGNLWCGWGMGSAELDGVRIFNPQGAPIGHIQLPERCANVCFGGPKGNRLFMAASHSLYALYVNTLGAPGG
jgi:gluconolactonase